MYMIQAKIIIATMAWNSLDFHGVNAFPKWQADNPSYDIEHILLSILKLRPDSSKKCPVIYADNDRPYNARKFQMF
jgi:hypothetical protein